MKKTFDKNNPPNIEPAGAYDVCAEYERDANLHHIIQDLDTEEDGQTRLGLFGSILVLATDIAEKDWERGCEIVIHNLQKIKTYITDDMVSAIINIAENDPQIGELNKVMNICGGYKFKQLNDVPEVISRLPMTGALPLLDLAEGYAHNSSPKLDELRSLRNAIDPRYNLPEGAGLDLH
ncbi:MAG: hypothetical protein ACRBDI_03350 [Alphaproteobacteria bacterium]